MKKILNVAQMRQLDAQTIKEEGITSLDLMERAARAVVRAIVVRWAQSTPVIVLAGPGNNGGDALAVARMLQGQGFTVAAYLFNTTGRLSPDCQANRDRLREIPAGNIDFHEVTDRFETPQLDASTLVVDGLFGTGLRDALTGGFASLVRFVNDSAAKVISIDVPSGTPTEMAADQDHAAIVRADLTVTFQHRKLSSLLDDAAAFWGDVEVADIGLTTTGIDDFPSHNLLLEADDVANILSAHPRPAFGHKGTFGHALLVAGQRGMCGAAVLQSRACLRSGVGKVTIHAPQANTLILQTAVPEAVLSLDASDAAFSSPVSMEAYDALCIGSGIGTAKITTSAFAEQIASCDKPLVVDADGINILASRPGLIAKVPRGAVLTPHLGEFTRLAYRHLSCGQALEVARNMAEERGIYIVLKGHHTAIVCPDGTAYFNTTGNSGLATAGSGDVLAGIITALLAQGYSPREASIAGVYLHGLAGDIAAERLTEYGVTASDVVASLPSAFRHFFEH